MEIENTGARKVPMNDISWFLVIARYVDDNTLNLMIINNR